MTLFIVGGSNSLFRDGWTAQFPSARNLSVGATTSLCGIFRCLQEDGPKRGDSIVWEYGINEIIHSRELYSNETILRNLELFLRLASQRKWKVVPLMLIPQKEEITGLPPYYYSAIQLFEQYGLNVVDANGALRQGLDNGSADLYSDPLHYRREMEVTGKIGKMVQNYLQSAAIPFSVQPVRSDGKMELFDLQASSYFNDSIMSVPLTKIPNRLNLIGFGEIRSIITLCRPGITSGIRMVLSRGSETLADARFSTTCKDAKTLLKSVNTDNLGNWSFAPGDILSFRYIKAGGWLYAEQGLKKKVRCSIPDDHIDPRRSALFMARSILREVREGVRAC